MTKVLIVDDASEARLIGKYLLRPYNVEVFEASNGKEAWAVIIREKPDVILLDLKMPLMDGFEVLQELHSEAYQIPVIVITSDTSNEVYKLCQALGVLGIFSKPVNLKGFHSTFSNVCQLS
ncbi:response regulator [Carboxylicivirga mesophila]|uniref:Response regulator n=1 Tax=Carboxylicivirga mesophila TaxID=1166478 RepID=A0ABS5KBS5_9BACT|nr:response regulator [Carboxylicivirga mesophila]MBS2212475.1 response regulator [Carboxylicivirga mesophila]